LNNSLLSTYYSFPIRTLYNYKLIWKFSNMWPTCQFCLEKWKQRSTIKMIGHFYIQMWPCVLWSATTLFFLGPKKSFLPIQMLISCNQWSGSFSNFFHIFSNQCTSRSYGYMCPKMFFFLKFGTCTRLNGNFGVFLVKK